MCVVATEIEMVILELIVISPVNPANEKKLLATDIYRNGKAVWVPERRENLSGIMHMSSWILKLVIAMLMATHGWGAYAQPYPSKTIKVIVVYPAGAVADVMLRIAGERLHAQFGQSLILDNRPGGSGIAGTQAVARANPDGYTLLMTGVNHITNNGLFSKLPYDSVRDFSPVGVIGFVPVVMVANPATAFKTVEDLIRAAKVKPGAINFASSGNGTAGHMATEMFSRAAGITMTHVPYRGGPQAVTDTVGGQVQINTLALSLAMPFIKDGRLVPLLQGGLSRDKALPNVPSMAEIGMRNFILDVWFGLLAPGNLDADAMHTLKTVLPKVMRDTGVITGLEAQNIIPASGDAAEMGRMLKRQMDMLPGFMMELGVKPE